MKFFGLQGRNLFDIFRKNATTYGEIYTAEKGGKTFQARTCSIFIFSSLPRSRGKGWHPATFVEFWEKGNEERRGYTAWQVFTAECFLNTKCGNFFCRKLGIKK